MVDVIVPLACCGIEWQQSSTLIDADSSDQFSSHQSHPVAKNGLSVGHNIRPYYIC